MGIDSINPLDRAGKSAKKDNKLPEAGDKSFQDELKLSSIKLNLTNGENEAALSSLTSNGEMLNLAKRVFEDAPIFAAFVAKMAVDEIMKKLDLEREKARELKALAEKYSQATKRIDPI